MPPPPRCTECCSGSRTTFVLRFGVWALAGIGFGLLGDLDAGIVIGAAFGIGAPPIAALAWLPTARSESARWR